VELEAAEEVSVAKGGLCSLFPDVTIKINEKFLLIA
jgi:hypothetical protein